MAHDCRERGRSYACGGLDGGQLSLVFDAPRTFDDASDSLQASRRALAQHLVESQRDGVLHADGFYGFQPAHKLAGRLGDRVLAFDDDGPATFLLGLFDVPAVGQEVYGISDDNRPTVLA